MGGLPKDELNSLLGKTPTRDLSITSPTFYHYVIEPLFVHRLTLTRHQTRQPKKNKARQRQSGRSDNNALYNTQRHRRTQDFYNGGGSHGRGRARESGGRKSPTVVQGKSPGRGYGRLPLPEAEAN